MYPTMAIITVATTTTAMIIPIATADIPSFCVVCLFDCSSLVLPKVVVLPDDETITEDIFVGKDDVVDEAVDVKTSFDSGCLGVDAGVWNSVVIVVLEIEYIDCVVEDVFLTSEVVEVESPFDGDDPVVWDNVADDDIVDCDVAMDDDDLNVNDVVENVDRGWIVGDEAVEDIDVDVVEADAGNVVGMNVVSVLVQSKTYTRKLISFKPYIEKKFTFLTKNKERNFKMKMSLGQHDY